MQINLGGVVKSTQNILQKKDFILKKNCVWKVKKKKNCWQIIIIWRELLTEHNWMTDVSVFHSLSYDRMYWAINLQRFSLIRRRHHRQFVISHHVRDPADSELSARCPAGPGWVTRPLRSYQISKTNNLVKEKIMLPKI